MNRSLNFNIAIPTLVALGIGVWFVILAWNGNLNVLDKDALVSAIKEIPTAGGYVATLFACFARWGWRWRIFQGWLVLVPNLNGTWKGKVATTWVDPSTGQVGPAKSAFLVIHQSLFSISAVLLTAESRSLSRAAAIWMDDLHQLKSLEFIYSNTTRVSVKHRSADHDGGAILDITSTPDRKLTGKYWTDRDPLMTRGELEFSFFSSKHRESFK